jgi:hypothetical protein
MQSSVPFALSSNRLEIDVVEGPLWSHETLAAAVEQFDKAKAKYVSHGWDTLPISQMGREGTGERANLVGRCNGPLKR